MCVNCGYICRELRVQCTIPELLTMHKDISHGYTAGYIIAVFFIFTSIFYFSWYIIRILYMLLLYFIVSVISYMLILVWVWENIMHIGLSYSGLILIGRGADIVLTDRVCKNGCIRCVDACTPLILLFPLLFCCVLLLF